MRIALVEPEGRSCQTPSEIHRRLAQRLYKSFEVIFAGRPIMKTFVQIRIRQRVAAKDVRKCSLT